MQAYRALVGLYPRQFRHDYGEDMVRHFADMVDDRGRRAAWSRTAIDLIVTVPRYRLESIMNESQSTTTMGVTLAALIVAAAVGVLTGLYLVGLVALVAAIGLGVARRSALAQAIRRPGENRRRNRLATAGVLALVCAAALVSYTSDLSDDKISGTSLMIHNLIGVPSMIGTVVMLVLGLFTPSSRQGSAPTQAA